MTRPDIRPMPDDFAEHAWNLSTKALSTMYRAGQVAVMRWRKELGGGPVLPPRGNAPHDYAAMAATMTVAMLRRHYGVSDGRIKRWSKLTGAQPCARAEVRRAIPADFAEVASTMTQTSLMGHYKADVRTIKRWASESGVNPAVPVFTPPQRSNGMIFRGHPGFGVHRDIRQTSVHDEAADVIRRERFVVHRSDERGRYGENGTFWRVGMSVLTPDELLARADRYRRRCA